MSTDYRNNHELGVEKARNGLNPEWVVVGPIREIPRVDQIDFTSEHVNVVVHRCHSLAKKSGWWENLIPPTQGTVAEKLLLIHSEISEACEGYRKDLMDDHLPHRKMVEVELADALIRICDLAGAMNLDFGGAVAEKLIYNQQRADHKPENRELAGGKKF